MNVVLTWLAAATMIGCSLVALPAQAHGPDRAADRVAAARPVGNDLAEALDEALDGVLAAGAAGVVAEVRWPGGRWSGSRGHVRDARATFRAGSVTKELLAVLILRLVARGDLRLDSTVGSVLPGILGRHGDVTVRQLLGHTSGAPDYLDALLRRGDEPRDLVRVFSRHRSDQTLTRIARSRTWEFEPGTSWGYSNTGYVVLGMMARAVTGRSVGDLLRSEVLEPAHMSASRLVHGPDPLPGLRERALVEGRQYPIDWFDPSNLSSAGGLLTTTGDLARFHRALGQGRLLPARLRRVMRAPQRDQPDYGLGTVIIPRACSGRPAERLYGHDGATLGTQTLSFGSADGRASVTVAATGLADEGAGPASLLRFLATAVQGTCH